MKNKKKLILVAVAFLLVIGLLVGGTLMLFTAQTPTAHNVVETGNVKVALYEKEGVNGTWFEITQDGEGIIFDGDYQPGQTVEKYAQINNIGENNAYIRVGIDFSFKDELSAGDYTLFDPLDIVSTADDFLWAALTGLWGYNLNDLQTINSDLALAEDGYYYYVENRNPATYPGDLKTFIGFPPLGDASDYLPIMSGFVIPKYIFADMDAIIAEINDAIAGSRAINMMNIWYLNGDTTKPNIVACVDPLADLNAATFNRFFTTVQRSPGNFDYEFNPGVYELSNKLADLLFSIDIYGQAVQADFNPYTAGDNWQNAFAFENWPIPAPIQF